MANETFTATQTTVLTRGNDADVDGVIDPGDIVTTTVTITNNSTTPTPVDATGVQFTEDLSGMTLRRPAGQPRRHQRLADRLRRRATTRSATSPAWSRADGISACSSATMHRADVEFFARGSRSTPAPRSTNTGVASPPPGRQRHAQRRRHLHLHVSAVGFEGTDTFTYTLRDTGLDGVAGNADDLTGTGTVTITVGPSVWFIDNTAPGSANVGTQANPFTSIAAFNAAQGTANGPDAGDIIYLRDRHLHRGRRHQPRQRPDADRPGPEPGRQRRHHRDRVGRPDADHPGDRRRQAGRRSSPRTTRIAASTSAPPTPRPTASRTAAARSARSPSPTSVDRRQPARRSTSTRAARSTSRSTRSPRPARSEEGIQLAGVAGSFTATTVSLNGMTGDGVDLDSNTATVTINGGSIGNSNDPGGIGVDINGGTGNVTIGATINKTTAGDVVEVHGPHRRHGRLQRQHHLDQRRRRHRSRPQHRRHDPLRRRHEPVDRRDHRVQRHRQHRHDAGRHRSGVGQQHPDHDHRHRAQRRQHDDRRRGPDVPEHLGQRRRATGIILNTTGSAGGLHVTGTGTRRHRRHDRNKTGADGSTTTGIGIYLNSTTDVSARLDAAQRLRRTSPSAASNVTGFTLRQFGDQRHQRNGAGASMKRRSASTTCSAARSISDSQHQQRIRIHPQGPQQQRHVEPADDRQHRLRHQQHDTGRRCRFRSSRATPRR